MPAAKFMDYPYFGTSHYAQCQIVSMPLTISPKAMHREAIYYMTEHLKGRYQL